MKRAALIAALIASLAVVAPAQAHTLKFSTAKRYIKTNEREWAAEDGITLYYLYVRNRRRSHAHKVTCDVERGYRSRLRFGPTTVRLSGGYVLTRRSGARMICHGYD